MDESKERTVPSLAEKKAKNVEERAGALGAGRYCDCKVCAAALGLGLTKFWELTKIYDFPKPLKIGRLCRWKVADVISWADRKAKAGELL